MSNFNSVLMGAVGMASLIVSIFFLRFWNQTRDAFFIYFACAFGLDSLSRFTLGLVQPANELEPLFYVLRLITFGLIIIAIALKNRPKKPGG